jgi:Skp family chaperone for outer membrane proteins
LRAGRGIRLGSWALALATAASAGTLAAQTLEQPGVQPGIQLTQPVPFVIVNQERLLTDTQRGRALLAEQEAARDRLRSEARAIDSAFEAEERELTEARATLEPEAFRALADDFDARVVTARRDQDARSAALAQEFDAGRRRFYAAIAPILVQLMERRGALAVLDGNSVLLAAQELDITEATIAEIDAMPEDIPPPGGDVPEEPAGVPQ